MKSRKADVPLILLVVIVAAFAAYGLYTFLGARAQFDVSGVSSQSLLSEANFAEAYIKQTTRFIVSDALSCPNPKVPECSIDSLNERIVQRAFAYDINYPPSRPFFNALKKGLFSFNETDRHFTMEPISVPITREMNAINRTIRLDIYVR